MIPPVPLDCVDKLTAPELEELWRELVVELMADRFAGRTHGNRRTYDAGCTGPMCRKDVREHGRRRNKTTPSERYKYLDLILEVWYPIAMDRVEKVRARLLEEIAPVS